MDSENDAKLIDTDLKTLNERRRRRVYYNNRTLQFVNTILNTGKYYLVDVGYPLQLGYIKPYSETRYHLPDFARDRRPIQGRKEIFNQAHPSLRSVIERTFGVWKKK
ncbi:hypothetical protein KSP39_PZI005377 [Platanthera zijinensis]|uniref:DDE Tnp4 domain-containing protein n=1 Tax=Platanthera zijinensis TaxID=2320716 RepID=A0AAP0BRH8_9ASPA